MFNHDQTQNTYHNCYRLIAIKFDLNHIGDSYKKSGTIGL